MFIAVRRRTVVLGALGLVLCVCALLALPRPAVEALARTQPRRHIYVIDAGHGGEDGGAVAADGTVESGINLAVAQRLEALLNLLGEETVMTRRADVSIHSAGAETLRQKKVSDLKNRAALAGGTPNALLVSIHQNSLPSSPRTRGAQVFYGTRGDSAAIARRVQARLNGAVNGSAKACRPVDPAVYLMKHADCPAILVECGFLSNAEEAALLRDESYQTRLAAVIAAGLLATEETGEGS